MELIKNILLRLFAVFICLFCFQVLGYSLSIYTPPPLYVPIDSLSKEHLYYDINPDFKENVFVYEIEGKKLSFKLKNNIQHHSTVSIDTTLRVRYDYYNSFIITPASIDEKSEIHFGFNKLISFTEDSIYVSAHYQKFSIEKGYNTGKYITIKSIAISKKDLAGVQLFFYPDGFKTGQDQLIAGYIITRGGENHTTNHAIELGWSRITSYTNMFTYSYYLSNEFAFNRNVFFIGPKIGVQFSLFMYGLGNEFVYYTDFHDSSLQWIPFFYLGMGNYKLHFNGRVPIYNKTFQNMYNFSVGFSMPIIPLSKRIVKL